MSEVGILVIGDHIIVPIQVELDDIAARKLQEAILQKIEVTGAKGMVIDISAVPIIDSFFGRVLIDTSKMARLMGTETVVAGMKKEVVLTIIHLGLFMHHLHTAINMEEGIALLHRIERGENEKADH